MNMSRTPDGYRAVFNDKIFQDQTLLNSVYQGFLSKHIREKGFGIEYKENGKIVDGNVSGAVYSFSFREKDSDYNTDYYDFTLNFTLSSESNFSGTYRMDERTFFTDYNESFFCNYSWSNEIGKGSAGKLRRLLGKSSKIRNS